MIYNTRYTWYIYIVFILLKYLFWRTHKIYKSNHGKWGKFAVCALESQQQQKIFLLVLQIIIIIISYKTSDFLQHKHESFEMKGNVFGCWLLCVLVVGV